MRRREAVHTLDGAGRPETLETVDQLVLGLPAADDNRRDLAVAGQRPRHRTFRFRHMQPIATVVLPDLFQSQIPNAVSDPVQHPFCLHPHQTEEERTKTGPSGLAPLPLPLLVGRRELNQCALRGAICRD